MLATWLLLFLHPFYVAVVDISHNKQEKILEISVRLFTDDFEKALQLSFPAEKVDLTHSKHKGNTDSLMSVYLRSKLRITVDGKVCSLTCLGSESVEESTWIYFEATQLSAPRNMNITNSVLYELRNEQINMHHVTVGGQSKSSKLDNPDTSVNFTF